MDVARAVRFVRKNAEIYGIDPDDIAVMGFSAGGIQAGEFLMHYDEDVTGRTLDSTYVPDELDTVLAYASAAGMIYSFYGRLSVGNMDASWLTEGDLPPTFYVYGTEDLFYRQFQFFVHFFRQAGLHDRIVKYIFSENLNHVYILTHFSYPFCLTPISISMFPAAMFSFTAHRMLASKKAVHFFDKQTAYLLPCISKLIHKINFD